MHSSGFWSAVLQPDELLTIVPGAPLRLTNVAVNFAVQNECIRATLVIKYCPKGTTSTVSAAIGSFVEGYTSKAIVCDLLLQSGEPFTFESFGGSILHLSGHFLNEDGEIHETKVTRESKPVRTQYSGTQDNRAVRTAPSKAHKRDKGTSLPSKSKKQDFIGDEEKRGNASAAAKGKRKQREELTDEGSTCTDYSRHTSSAYYTGEQSNSESEASASTVPRTKKLKTH
ncbi:hypothetical protein CVT26_014609 [Gymnopilus dilepis]|uniref:Nucleoplasmin-like domain-containing protein n=1 Tax=Gymnopilus dilepis TaxID=231916 RepID=A0A409X1V0_9AGAR|nr:hypothetical protein CVT26_014609 [Gymnopilus dilepis]